VLRVDSAWPLPMPDYLAPFLHPNNRSITPREPHYDVLLDMAIAAKKPDDALHWYDKNAEGTKTRWRRLGLARGETAIVCSRRGQVPSGTCLGIYQRALEKFCRKPTHRLTNWRPDISKKSTILKSLAARPLGEIVGRDSFEIWQSSAIYGSLGQARRAYHSPDPKSPKTTVKLPACFGKARMAADRVRKQLIPRLPIAQEFQASCMDSASSPLER